MRNKTIIALVATAAVVAGACSSGAEDVAGPGAQGAAGAAVGGSDKKTIILEVTGPKKADITYGLGIDTSQDNGAKLPWKKTLTSTESILMAQVSAQNSGSGTITCKITVNGKVAKTNASKGQYSIVDCNVSDF